VKAGAGGTAQPKSAHTETHDDDDDDDDDEDDE